MSCLAPRLRWLSADGAVPARETRPLQYVRTSTYCTGCLAIISPFTQLRSTITRCVPSRLPVAKSPRTFIFSCIPMFQPPKALSLAPSYLYRAGGYGGDRTGGRADGHTDGLDHLRAYVDVNHICSAVHDCSLEVLDVDGSPSEVLWSICALTDEQTGAGAPGERADDMGFI